jgi:hypothetical protein
LRTAFFVEIREMKREKGRKGRTRKKEHRIPAGEDTGQKMQTRVFVGAWVAETFAVEVNDAAKARRFPNRSEFVRYALEFAVKEAV